MPVLRLHVETAGGVRQIDALVSSLSDLGPALKRWNKYFRKRVQKKFDAGGPGWPGIKPQTDAAKPGSDALKELADQILRVKLRRDLKRARNRFKRGSGTADKVARRYDVLKEFERIAAGGQAGAVIITDAKTAKSVAGLRERYQRAEVKASSRPLGRIASSIKSKLTKTSASVFSSIEWSDAHNEGATVGHGAKLPKREFLDLDDADIRMLVMLIEEQARQSTE